MKKVCFLLFLSIFCSCSKNKENIESYLGFDIPKDSISSYLNTQMETKKINGISLAVINDGKIVYEFIEGYANKERKTPVTNSTIFEGASISKSVFAFFVMTFVEDGTLDLDKPLYKYLPKKEIEYDERYKKITARMVLSHQSGFQNWREDDADKKLKIQFDPGTNYRYSGEGYQYLAEVLKDLLQTNWNGLEEEFQKRVAKPLGLQNTVFIQKDKIRKHKATPYDKTNKEIDWKNNYWFQKNDTVFSAPASIHSEAKDFSKWMIAVMNKKLLTEKSYQELLQPHSKIPKQEIPLSYTLGFVKPEIPFTNIYMHGGNNIGFTSYFVLDTQKNWGFVLFTNSEYGEQLGMDFLYHTAAGPNRTKLYGIVIFALILSITIIVLIIKKAIRLFRNR